jgi:DNA uptake protein ComE-like DNA-binding protein
LQQYVFIPVKINSATDEDLLSIPGMTQGRLAEIKQNRPWKSKDQFDQAIGKSAGAKEAARLWRFMVIE